MNKKIYELDGRVAALLGVKEHAGYLLPFSKNQAKGAWENGSRVVKDGSDPDGDMTPDGIEGKILGSLKTPDGKYAYFVEWDNKPKMPIFCVQEKLRLLKGE